MAERPEVEGYFGDDEWKFGGAGDIWSSYQHTSQNKNVHWGKYQEGISKWLPGYSDYQQRQYAKKEDKGFGYWYGLNQKNFEGFATHGEGELDQAYDVYSNSLMKAVKQIRGITEEMNELVPATEMGFYQPEITQRVEMARGELGDQLEGSREQVRQSPTAKTVASSGLTQQLQNTAWETYMRNLGNARLEATRWALGEMSSTESDLKTSKTEALGHISTIF